MYKIGYDKNLLNCFTNGRAIPSEKRTRKRRRFIGFLLFPVFPPQQAKAMLSDVTSQLGSVKTHLNKKRKKTSLSRSLDVV